MTGIPLTLTVALIIFAAGFILYRSASVKTAAITFFLLGALVMENHVVKATVGILKDAFKALV